MSTLKNLNYMLVLGGNMMAIDKLGTSCHFNLLPVPWDSEEFKKQIASVLQQELYWHELMSSQPELVNQEILERPIGIRMWKVTDAKQVDELGSLHHHMGLGTLSDKDKIRVFQYIDSLSMSTEPDFIYVCDSLPIDIETTVDSIEAFCVNQLKIEDQSCSSQSSSIYRIFHTYDVGDQSVYISQANSQVNAKEAALYLQFKAEEYFGSDAWLSNLGLAALMIQFYGFQQCAFTNNCEQINMYSDREWASTTEIYQSLISKKELYRENLKDQIKFFLRSEVNFDNETEEYTDDLFDHEEAYRITYFYGDGGAPVFIKRVDGTIDALQAALYCEFMCEEWFGSEKMLTNLGIASLLITFYGFQHHSGGPYNTIDMYSDRAAFRGDVKELLADKTLYREKLREHMEPHVISQ